MIGPGKYDALVPPLIKATKGQAVVLMVFHGVHGHGLAIQCKDSFVDEFMARLPGLLRELAATIEHEGMESTTSE